MTEIDKLDNLVATGKLIVKNESQKKLNALPWPPILVSVIHKIILWKHIKSEIKTGISRVIKIQKVMKKLRIKHLTEMTYIQNAMYYLQNT